MLGSSRKYRLASILIGGCLYSITYVGGMSLKRFEMISLNKQQTQQLSKHIELTGFTKCHALRMLKYLVIHLDFEVSKRL